MSKISRRETAAIYWCAFIVAMIGWVVVAWMRSEECRVLVASAIWLIDPPNEAAARWASEDPELQVMRRSSVTLSLQNT
jgi:hypothetical protein